MQLNTFKRWTKQFILKYLYSQYAGNYNIQKSVIKHDENILISIKNMQQCK